MKTLWTFERSESIHPLDAPKPRTGLTKFERDSIQHSIFENRKQHVASASVLLRNVCITSWTTISSSLSSSSIWILMMIESRVIEALFRSTLSLNQGSSSCRRPPNLISRLIGEEGGAIKLNFGKQLVHDWRRSWQTNPILKISDWIGRLEAGRPIQSWKSQIGLVCQLLLRLEKKLADQSNPENPIWIGLPASTRRTGLVLQLLHSWIGRIGFNSQKERRRSPFFLRIESNYSNPILPKLDSIRKRNGVGRRSFWELNPILPIQLWRSWQTNPILKIRFGLVCQLLIHWVDWCSSFFTDQTRALHTPLACSFSESTGFAVCKTGSSF